MHIVMHNCDRYNNCIWDTFEGKILDNKGKGIPQRKMIEIKRFCSINIVVHVYLFFWFGYKFNLSQ